MKGSAVGVLGLLFTAVLATAACSFGNMLDGYSGGSRQEAAGANDVDGGTSGDDAATPSTGDGSQHLDATTDDGPGAVNLMTNGDFELGCAGWTTAFGFISESSVARGGAGSCRFCMDTNWEAVLEQKVKVPVKAGDKFVGEIWVHGATAPADLEAKGLVGSSLRIYAAQGDPDGTSGPKSPADWTRITTLFTATADRTQLTLQLRLQQTGNPASVGNVICVDVDDAVLRPMTN